ncbi:MAG: hypothetical protein QOG70_3003 [Solirubrobacteraceae bacterium]|nr:hypothetical protein [Solirubrobacteraceae bacterium]
MRFGPLRRSILLLPVLAVSALATPAQGAEYTVVTCAGESAATAGWMSFAGGGHPLAFSENCPSTRGAMVAQLNGSPSPVAGSTGWQVFAPAGTTVGGVTLTRELTVFGTGYDYIARGVTPAAPAAYATIETCTSHDPCTALTNQAFVVWRAPRPDINRIQVYVECAAAASCEPTTRAPIAVRVTRADISLTDNTAPTITVAPSSPMFAAPAPVTSPQGLTTTFTDVGGGVASTGLMVDSQVLDEAQVPTATCRAPYRTRVPCPLTFASRLQFDPASVSDGPHAIQVFARDATGANIVASQPFAVVTRAHGVVTGSSATGSDEVRLTFGVRRAAKAGHQAPQAQPSATVPFDGRAVAVGRLVDAAGQPVTGARLTVSAAVDLGVPQFAQLAGDVTTDTQGRFRFTIHAGPSRRVRVSYFARVLDGLPAGEAQARVKVTTRASLRAPRRSVLPGERAVFHGRVAGTYRPPGLRVELQERRGRAYVTVATAATRPDGTYRVSYRVARRARGRLVFRLRVPHDGRFPYFLGFSRPVGILVG